MIYWWEKVFIFGFFFMSHCMVTQNLEWLESVQQSITFFSDRIVQQVQDNPDWNDQKKSERIKEFYKTKKNIEEDLVKVADDFEVIENRFPGFLVRFKWEIDYLILVTSCNSYLDKTKNQFNLFETMFYRERLSYFLSSIVSEEDFDSREKKAIGWLTNIKKCFLEDFFVESDCYLSDKEIRPFLFDCFLKKIKYHLIYFRFSKKVLHKYEDMCTVLDGMMQPFFLSKPPSDDSSSVKNNDNNENGQSQLSNQEDKKSSAFFIDYGIYSFYCYLMQLHVMFLKKDGEKFIFSPIDFKLIGDMKEYTLRTKTHYQTLLDEGLVKSSESFERCLSLLDFLATEIFRLEYSVGRFRKLCTAWKYLGKTCEPASDGTLIIKRSDGMYTFVGAVFLLGFFYKVVLPQLG